MCRRPAFSLAAILTLALGVGANATIFGAVHAILIRPLPYDPDARLVHIIENVPAEESFSGAPERSASMDPSIYQEWRKRTQTLSHMAQRVPVSMTLRGDTAVRLNGTYASAPFLPMCRVRPLLGQLFGDAAERPGAENVIVLAYHVWRDHFGADPQIIGRPIKLDDSTFTVAAVMPSTFACPDALSDFWAPLVLRSEPGQVRRFGSIARLRDGQSVAVAAREAATLSQQLLDLSPDQLTVGGHPRFQVVTLEEELIAPARVPLTIFSAAVTFVLLIACVNVGNLFVMRATARAREFAVRRSLGAGRRRLFQQLVIEGLVISAAGGALGTLIAVAASTLLVALGHGLSRGDLSRVSTGATAIPRLDEINVDGVVLAYTAALTVGLGIFFGCLSYRQSRTARLTTARVSSPADRDDHRSPIAGVSLAVQVALTMTLALGAGLLLRSFVQLVGAESGYDAESVVTFQTPRSLGVMSDDFRGQLRLQRQALTSAEAIVTALNHTDGVDAAAFTSALPLVQSGFLLVVTEGAGAPKPIADGKAMLVSPDYFRVMRMRIASGRGFVPSDRQRQRATFVVNRSLVTRYFGGVNPVGQSMHLWGSLSGDVVGVVDDVRQSSLARPAEPQLFMTPYQTQEFLPVLSDGVYFAVRTRLGPAILPRLRAVVDQVDAGAPVDRAAMMTEIVSNSVLAPRSYATLCALCAAVAVLLAAIGLYGVAAYAVARRTHEIGIRLALGARPVEVVALVLRQGVIATLAGIVAGLAGAALLTRYLETILFGVTPLDPATFVLSPLLMLGLAALSCYVPARRATRVDAVVALNQE